MQQLACPNYTLSLIYGPHAVFSVLKIVSHERSIRFVMMSCSYGELEVHFSNLKSKSKTLIDE